MVMDGVAQRVYHAPMADLFEFEPARGDAASRQAGIDTIRRSRTTTRSGTFADNLKLPVHRWFRYSAGFSADWVEDVIRRRAATRILDPFCGSGTSLVAAAKAGAYSVGIEAHPFVSLIAKIKTRWDVDLGEMKEVFSRVRAKAWERRSVAPATESKLLLKCYDAENLIALESLRRAYEDEVAAGLASEGALELVWLALTCVLRECSSVGTAQWQYVLPNKKKAKVKHPYPAFEDRQRLFVQDLMYARSQFQGFARVICGDARDPDIDELDFDLVITSPPYPNNYDYADATRLEMTFWEEVDAWGDLHDAVRKHLVCSCSQHSAADRLDLVKLLDMPRIDAIRDELTAVCTELEQVRLTKGGRKTYHTMVAAYFSDLTMVWIALRRLTGRGSQIAFVVGDSAPYGVHVPCDEWLGRLAVSAGFKGYWFEKIRDRNTKWRNRKHRIPLKEGILWVEG